jgi:phosphoribosylamine--glycine ligase
MEGEEASFFFLCDGKNVLPLATAQDHKRVGDGDTGPNTGGMGAYSPAPCMTNDLIERTIGQIIEPTMRGMADAGTPFKGVLYCGLMLTAQGPKLVEYNVRFGDPECQVLMMRLKSDLVPALLAAARGDLSDQMLEWSNDFAMTIVMAANGYPGSYEKGSQIKLPDLAGENGFIFHAGTKLQNGQVVANGGRVLNVTAMAQDVQTARDRAYDLVAQVKWDDGFYRSDIGWRAL